MDPHTPTQPSEEERQRAARQRRIKLREEQLGSGREDGIVGEATSSASAWINDNFRTLRRAALAVTAVGAAVALYSSPGFTRHTAEAVRHLTASGKMQSLRCQVLRADAGMVPTARTAATLPLLWVRHAPPGKTLLPYPSRPTVEALSKDPDVFMVAPLGVRLPEQGVADAHAVNWMRRTFTPPTGVRPGTPAFKPAYTALRTTTDMHPSLVRVQVQGEVSYPPQGEAGAATLLLGAVTRPAPWWAAAPAFILRRIVSPALHQGSENLFASSVVLRGVQEPGTGPGLIPHVVGPPPAPPLALAAPETPQSSPQQKVLMLLPPAPPAGLWGRALSALTPPAFITRAVSSSLAATAAAASGAVSSSASAVGSAVSSSASAAVDAVVPRALRGGGAKDAPPSAYTPPPEFAKPPPPPPPTSWWWPWAAQAPLPDAPPNPEAPLEWFGPGRRVDPREELFAMGRLGLGTHLARHGGAVPFPAQVLELLRGGGGEGALGGPTVTAFVPPHVLAGEVAEAEAGQATAAHHGLGVWLDPAWREAR